MGKIALYWQFTKMQLKANMEYRLNFFMGLFLQIFWFSIGLVGIWSLFTRFTNMSGWSYYEVMFSYGLNSITYGICAVFVFDPMRRIGRLIQTGEFDNILTRPIDPFFHMLARTVGFPFLYQSVMGMIVLGVCISHLAIDWTAMKVAWLLLALVGGTLIQASIFIIGGALSFWFGYSSPVVDTLTENVRRFIDYPVSLYVPIVQGILTFVVPYAFVNYYPSVFLLGKPSESLLLPMLQYGTPVVGLLLSLLAATVWRRGLKRYQSTGS